MAATFKISAEDLSKALRNRGRATPVAVDNGMYLAAERGRTLLVHKSPVDRGKYKDAWLVHRRRSGPTIENDAPYAGIIEEGARPHPVSREGWESIYFWVYHHRANFGMVTKSGRTKRVDAKGWQSAGRSGGQSWEENPAIAAITWAIVRRIRTRPTEGKYIVMGSLDKLTKFTGQEIKRALSLHARDPRAGFGLKGSK